VNARVLVPMMNVINGGAHADNSVDLQEFMIVRRGETLFRKGCAWGPRLSTIESGSEERGYSTAVGDEGGFAPNLKSNEEALEVLMERSQGGYKAGEQIAIALDPASSEFYDKDKKKYVFKKSDKSEKTPDRWWSSGRNGPGSIQSSRLKMLAEDDWDGWKTLTDALGSKLQLVGDDLFVTNSERLQRGIDQASAIRFW